MRQSPLALLCWLLLQASGPALGQDSEPQDVANWYRVELIIFANRDPDTAFNERWPLLPELAYPEQLQRLRDGATRQPANAEHALVRIEDSVPPAPIDLLWSRSSESLHREFEQKRRYPQADIELEPLYELSVPRTLVELDDSEQEFASQRRRINNRSNLEVLFHETWLQPIPGRERALPLLLDTPVQFGDYPELQGSILIYSSRYLHVSTNLWLNTAGHYLDNNWRMPRPPLAAADPATELLPFQLTTSPDWLQAPVAAEPSVADFGEPTNSEPTFSEPTISELTFGELTTEPADELNGAGDAASAGVDVNAEPTAAATVASAQALAAFMELPVYDYPFRHAVLVQQNRRMRSGELHYIDHPLLGIMIKINRHEFQPFVESAEDANAALAGSR